MVRHTILMLAALLACTPKDSYVPPRNTSDAVLVSSKRNDSPFGWKFLVKYPDSTVKVYRPGNDPQGIPLAQTEWVCTQTGLRKAVLRDGSYVEMRDVTCQVATGHNITTRTLCARDQQGNVFEDSNTTMLGDNVSSHVIIVSCEEIVAPTKDPSPTDKGGKSVTI